jgi:hypothetical protein
MLDIRMRLMLLTPVTLLQPQQPRLSINRTNEQQLQACIRRPMLLTASSHN